MGETAHVHNLTSQKFYCDVTLNELYTKGLFIPKIEGKYFTITIYHKLLRYTNLCAPFVVSSIFEAAKRLSVHKTRKKKPITVESSCYCTKN